jgi:FMN phosphatase YigB (HAD superfamily)
MAEIKHIIFDLNEVLMNGAMDFPDSIERMIEAKTPDFNIGKGIYSSFFGDNSHSMLFRGELSEDEFFEEYLRKGNYPLTVEELKRLMRKNFWEFTHAKPILSGLKTNGYDLLLLSDHAKEWVQYVEFNFPFLSFFRQRFYSCDLHHTKLETEAFRQVISRAEINPKQSLFIDDSIPNLERAREAGIKYTHAYRDPVRLTRHFKELGIKGFWEKGFSG